MGSRDEVERMIGKRVEDMKALYIIGWIVVVAATYGGIWVGFTYYPWAYPFTSGMYAFSVLFVIETLGFIFIWKMATEKPVNP